MDIVFYKENMYFHLTKPQGEQSGEVQILGDVQALDFDSGNEDKTIQVEVSPLQTL